MKEEKRENIKNAERFTSHRLSYESEKILTSMMIPQSEKSIHRCSNFWLVNVNYAETETTNPRDVLIGSLNLLRSPGTESERMNNRMKQKT